MNDSIDGANSPLPQENPFGLFKFDMPWKALPIEQRIEAVSSTGSAAAGEFTESFSELDSLIKSANPILLLVHMGLQLTSADGSSVEWESENPLLQHHVELLQALTLRHDWNSFGFQLIDLEKVEVTLKSVSQAFYLKRLADVSKDADNSKRTDRAVRESIRIQTQAVRNWGYPHHMRRLICEMLTPLDPKFISKLGIPGTAIVEWLFHFSDVFAGRLNLFEDARDQLLEAHSIEEALSVYSKHFFFDPELKTINQSVKEEPLSLEELQDALMSRTVLFLPIVSRFTPNDLVRFFPRPPDSSLVLNLVKSLSLPFGSLGKSNPEHLFMNNPIWTKPFVALEDGSVLVTFPGFLISFALDIVESLMDDELMATYKKRRANYLEEKLQELFEKHIPTARVYRGSLWSDGTQTSPYENDLLVVTDSFAFVIESKSGKVAPTARRGGDRLERAISDLLVDPTNQGKRFAEYLKNGPGTYEFETLRGEINKVDVTAVRHFFCFNATFDDMSAVADHPELQRAGLIEQSIQLAPTILLADWLIIFEVLESPSYIVHYLKRRAELPGEVQYVGDELDLLYSYLQKGLNLPTSELQDSELIFWGNSQHFDPYFMGQITGLAQPKPQMVLTKWWRDLIKAVETKSFPRWTEVACLLLGIAYDDQLKIEAGVESLRQAVLKPDFPENDQTLVFQNGLHGKKDGLTFMQYKNYSRDERHQALLNGAGMCFDSSEVTLCVALARHVDRNTYPYEVLMICEPRADQGVDGNGC